MLDPRLGLNKSSLSAWGNMFPKSSETYFVTNSVAFFSRFKKCCAWSHARWEEVFHSAMLHMRSVLNTNTRETPNPETTRQQNLQMWSDWYTILKADTVYHVSYTFRFQYQCHPLDEQSSINYYGVQYRNQTIGNTNGILVTGWRNHTLGTADQYKVNRVQQMNYQAGERKELFQTKTKWQDFPLQITIVATSLLGRTLPDADVQITIRFFFTTKDILNYKLVPYAPAKTCRYSIKFSFNFTM